MTMNNDMPQQPDWEDVTALWQAGGPDIDVADLFQRARLNWWKIRFSVITNMLASLIGACACIWASIHRPSLAVIIFCLFGLVFCITSGRFTYQYYKDSSGNLTKDTKALLGLQIRQLKSIITFARFNFWACFAVFIFGLIALAVLRESELWHGQLAVYYVIALTAITLIIYPLYYRRVIAQKNRELDEITSSLEALEEAEE